MGAKVGWMLVGLWLAAAPVAAAEPVRVAVMEFNSKGGVTQQQMDALGDLLSTEIRALGGYKVIGKNDIRSVLRMEENKALLGCDDAGCLAEIGGALGVRWVVVGNVSRFGELYLLNLKIIDSQRVEVLVSAAERVKGGQEALVEALPQAVADLFGQAEQRLRSASGGAAGGAAADTASGGTTADGAASGGTAADDAAAGGTADDSAAGGGRPAAVAHSAPASAFNTWGHVAFWSGVGLAAVGGVFIWQAEVAAEDWTYSGAASDADRHRTFNGLAYAGFGLGGALLVTGAVLWLLDPGPPAADAGGAVSLGGGPTPDGRGLGLSLGGRW
jgi:TolB-like protein